MGRLGWSKKYLLKKEAFKISLKFKTKQKNVTSKNSEKGIGAFINLNFDLKNLEKERKANDKS